MALYLSDLSQNPSPVMRKVSDRLKSRDMLHDIWPGFFKTDNVIKNKENLRNCSQEREQQHEAPQGFLRDFREPGQVLGQQGAERRLRNRDWMGPRAEKGHEVKTMGT